MKNLSRGKFLVRFLFATVPACWLATAALGGDDESKVPPRKGMPGRRFKMKRGKARGDKFLSERGRGKMGMIMSRLSDDERKELAELRKSDREAFKNKIRELVKKYKRQMAKEHQEVNALVKKIRKAASDDERKKLIGELRVLLRKQFEAKMAINRRNYEQAKRKLMELKKRLDAREARADEIIERRIQDLTIDPDLKW